MSAQQLDIFGPPPPRHSPEVVRRVDALLGQAFVLHTEADEEHSPARRARLRAEAVALEEKADGIVPVEERTWLR